MSGALGVFLFGGADLRWGPLLVTIALLFALPEIVSDQRKRRIYQLCAVLGCVLAVGICTVWSQSPLVIRPVPGPSVPQPEPVLYLQPDYALRNPHGSFSLQLLNSGPDIEHVSIHLDYFVAQKKEMSILINRVFQVEEAPTPLPMRTNQSKTVDVSFSGGYMTALYAHFGFKYPALLGVKVTVTFRRYSDGKRFSKVWTYAVVGTPGSNEFKILYSAGTLFDTSGPPENKDRAVSLSEVIPYIDSNDHWVDPVVTLMPDGSIKTR